MEIPPDPGLATDPARARVIWRGERIEVPIVARPNLTRERSFAGPMIVTEYSATTWCPPAWTLRPDAFGALHLTRG
jgi:hypothetical protein